MIYGPQTSLGKEIHATKYRVPGESFEEAMTRVAASLKDGNEDFRAFLDILLNMRFLPGGRIQCAMGSPRRTTPYNCFVTGKVPDSMKGIMAVASEAAQTMRMGGGVGYDFSTIRPKGFTISSTMSKAGGPLNFMGIFDAVCETVESAGNRRGAQMGVLRVDHPDIEDFVLAKQGTGRFKRFNLSVAVTDKFMAAVDEGAQFSLMFHGQKVRDIDARALWEQIMRSTWNWAEPGVIFIDRINAMNNLWYCEKIAATNPCAEQPLPPHGACLLGSFNLVKYITDNGLYHSFDWYKFQSDIPWVVRAMDNVVDRALYPLPQQEQDALQKRRMGLGVTGLANALEVQGYPYGSRQSVEFARRVLTLLRDVSYATSVDLAIEKGAFELFRADAYCEGAFIKTLPDGLRERIARHGIRNSHLTSIAPTGTISLTADNVSSGVEPVFAKEFTRDVIMEGGQRRETVKDYGYAKWGVNPVVSSDVTAQQHIDMLCTASLLVDSAVSKTCNVDDKMAWDDFKGIYWKAYHGGAKGCTTYNKNGKLAGVLQSADIAEACSINADGSKTCG
jgi:ribonucleoside-diphosphate reductase alpha chain